MTKISFSCKHLICNTKQAKYWDFELISSSLQIVGDDVQTVTDDALSLPSVLQDAERFDFHFFGSMLNISGQATPSCTTASMKMLMSVFPNCQLVLSMASCNGPIMGSSLNMSRATMSESSVCLAQKRCILRKHDDAEAGESKQAANLEKHTVLALHRAIMKSDMSLMWARLIFFRRNRLTCLKIDYFCYAKMGCTSAKFKQV